MNRTDLDTALTDLLADRAERVGALTAPGLLERAERSGRRRLRIRRAGATLGASGAAAVVAALVVTVPGPDGGAVPAAPSSPVCGGPVPASAAPELLYLPDDDDLRVDSALLVPRACGGPSDGRAVQVLVDVSGGGEVRSAVTVWDAATAPVATGPEGADGVEGTASPGDTFPPWDWPVVRDGVQAQMLVSTYVQVWWSEAGSDYALSASGLTPQQTLALVEEVRTDGRDGVALPDDAVPTGLRRVPLSPPAGTSPGRAWVVQLSDRTATTGTATGGRSGFEAPRVDLTVSDDAGSWAQELSRTTPGTSRVVEVGGRPATLGDNGTPAAGLLRYDLADGTDVLLMGSTDGTPDSLVGVAESLHPVTPDDPRVP